MMKSHRPSRGRMLAGAGAILGLAGLSLAFGTPGLAQTDSNTTTTTQSGTSSSTSSDRHEQRIIIRTDGDGHTTTTTTNGAGPDGTTTERVIVRTTRTGHGAADATAGAEAHHDGDAPGTRTEHVFIMSTNGDHQGGPHQFELVRNGNPIITPDCNNGHADEVNEGTDGNHTRVILCSSGNVTPAQRADRLQHVRDQMAADSELGDEQKAHVLAALDRQIAQLRGAH